MWRCSSLHTAFKGFDFCKYVSALGTLKRFNKSGYTYSIWGTPPICLRPLGTAFSPNKYSDTHHLPKSVNRHSSPLNVPRISRGQCQAQFSVQKQVLPLLSSIFEAPQGSYGAQKKPSLAENLSQKYSGTLKSS